VGIILRHGLYGLIVLPILASAGEKSTAVIDDVAYTRPQKLVGVEPGRRLNLYCTGSGSPTVVFESGLGDGTRVWGLIQPSIAKHTRACSYDRAVLGFSDPPTRPSTSANMVDDLHRLLRTAHVKPPYVLVGSSLGGMNVKLFAESYLSEVAGLVFVDASHEDLGKGAWDIDPESRKTYAPYDVQVDIDEELLREFDQAAQSQSITRNDAVRGALATWLSQARRDAALRELFDSELEADSLG
jgi:pimeloyl-ACP methyl ester carboxylesterase